MSLTNIEQVMPVKLAQALANPLFPALDSALRAGRHIGLDELDMMVGKILCYLYLSPERLANEGIFTQQELYDELLTLADESRLLKLVNNSSTGSDLDRQKLQEKMRASLNRLRRLGMVWFMGHDSSKFRITESVFRFGADVRAGDDPREAQRRLIRDGEAMALENHLQLNDENEENQPDSGEEE